jgi:hypothetical protein
MNTFLSSNTENNQQTNTTTQNSKSESNQLPTTNKPNYTIQTTLQTTNDNLPFGDIMQHKSPQDIRIYFQNINGIYRYKSWKSFSQSCQLLKQCEIDSIAVAETNIKWDTRYRLHVNQCIKTNIKFVTHPHHHVLKTVTLLTNLAAP